MQIARELSQGIDTVQTYENTDLRLQKYAKALDWTQRALAVLACGTFAIAQIGKAAGIWL